MKRDITKQSNGVYVWFNKQYAWTKVYVYNNNVFFQYRNDSSHTKQVANLKKIYGSHYMVTHLDRWSARIVQ